MVKIHYATVYVFMVVSCLHAADSMNSAVVLTPTMQKTLDSVATSFTVASCGSAALAQLRQHHPPCRMADRLYPFAQWLAAKGKTGAECLKDLSDRQSSFSDTQRFAIDLAGVSLAGDSSAAVTIVVYISGLCPLCKYVSCELYREVTSGTLKGKARLAAKPCRAAKADEAIVAAAHFKKPWEFLLALHAIKIRPDEPVLLKLADSLGMDSVAFKQYLSTRELQTVIERNSAEAVRNGVSIAPTIFINNRRYHSYKDPRWVVDAALYEFEAARKPRR